MNPSMQSFDHLLTTRPHDISMVFISDLHLSRDTPSLNDAFLTLLKDLSVLPNLQRLFILGDWLDGWIGDDDYLTLSDDDKQHHFLTPILAALKKMSSKTVIHVMHGNRDFAIRQALCDTFNGKLIKEVYYLTLAKGATVRLEHGDRLCTDDKAYQHYRAFIQNPVITWLILKQPLAKRRQLAQKLKAKSDLGKSTKPSYIMDVNPQATQKAMQTCDLLIHGHTHRPDVHVMDNKKRLVLGDWRYEHGKATAVIGVYVSSNDHTDEIDECDKLGLWRI